MQRSTFQRWAPGCALLLLLLGLPASLWRAERRVTALLEQALSTVSGERVSIESVMFTFEPALVLDRVRVADALSIARIELAVDLTKLSRPRLASVTLLRPTLTLSERHGTTLWRRLRRSAALRAKPPAAGAPALARAPRPADLDRLRIVDGRVVVQLWRGAHRYALDMRRINLAPRLAGAPTRRLVLGATRLTRDRVPLISLAASGLELDSALRLRRAAVLGGRLVLPAALSSSPTGAALTLQTLRLRRRRDARLRLTLKARPPRRDAGHLWLSLDLAGTSLSRAHLRLSGLRTAPYAPLLARYGWLADGSRIDGAITVTRVAGDARHAAGYAVRADLSGRDVRIRHPWIAAGVVGPFNASVETRAHLAHSGLLDVERLRLASGALELRLAGRLVAGPTGVRLAVDGVLPRLPCQRLLTDLPRGFAPHLDGMGVDGDVGARVALRVDSAALDRTQVDLTLRPRGIRSCKVRVDPPAADVNTLAKALTIAVGGARGRGRRLVLGKRNADYRRYKRIPKHVRDAFVVAEDTHFFRHAGFDVKQLANAFVANLRAGRPVRGASTISQQLVKNVFLHHARTLSRKFEEMVLTWRMEQVLSKRRILELYLNMVEMGPGTYGVQAAATRYFGRDVAKLTPLQAAHLAALTPAPRPLSRRFARNGPDAAWMGKLRLLLRLMRRSGSISRRQQRAWAKRKLVLVRR